MLKTLFKTRRWTHLLVIGSMLLATLGLTSAVLAKATCNSPYIVQSGDTLKGIAQKCGVSLQALLDANPAITNPNLIYRGQRIVIPTSSSNPTQYTVQPGDTLDSIAEHFGVSVGLIMLSNPQIINPTRLSPGQVITIPSVPIIPETGSQATLQLSLYNGLSGTRLTITGSGFPAKETVYVAASSNGSTSSASTNANTDKNGKFTAQLRIPTDAPAGSVWVIEATPQSANNPLATATFRVITLPTSGAYVVQSGDTLGKIAQRYHTTVNALIRANPQISNPNLLNPGDLIYLPGSVLVDPNTGLTIYIVISGDYLGAIAQRFGTSLQALLAANPQIQTPSRIYPGDRLTIPTGSVVPVSGSGPRLQIAPTSGQPGSQVSVVGSGFPANVTVYVSASLQGQAPSVTVEAETDANGNFTTLLTIPTSATPGGNWVISASTATATANFSVVAPAPSNPYTVRSGDTIGSIAQRFGIPVRLLERANPQLANPSHLTPGEQITIPARISFASGGTSAVVSGSLNAGSDTYYVLRAGAGQLMEVTSSPDPSLQMAIYAADGSTIKALASSSPNFRGYLPASQDYLLVVHALQAVPYTLNVDIPARISFAAGAISSTTSGSLAPYASQYYVLRALKGQQLMINVSPTDENLRLVIYGFDGSVLRSGMSSGAPSFNGTLPSTQDYIVILTASDQAVSYTMHVTIPAL
jgi:LysM repeat protein